MSDQPIASRLRRPCPSRGPRRARRGFTLIELPAVRKRQRAAFTLIELLVVIGIIVLLISLTVPAVIGAWRKARNTRVAADLQAIATGLEAYRTDFGDYPRVDIANTGFAVLCKALVGPGPGGGPLPTLAGTPYAAGTYTSTGAVGTAGYQEFVAFGQPRAEGGFATGQPTSDLFQWAPMYASDGKDGPGFRVRLGSKTYGPYLQAEKFRVRDLAIRDMWDNPILYFPARPGKLRQDTDAGRTWQFLVPGAGPPVVPPLFEAADNLSFFLDPFQPAPNGESLPANTNQAVARMDAIIVRDSIDFDGIIEGTESPRTTSGVVLWSAGADGRFGVVNGAATPTKKQIGTCDDVVNFER